MSHKLDVTRIKHMRLSNICLLVIGIMACGQSGAQSELTTREKDSIRAEVERTLREAYDVSKPGMAERMLSLYPRGGRVVSANSGKASASRDTLEAEIRYFWENVGVNMRQPRWVWDRFYVDVLSPTAAAVTATYNVPHLNPRNEPHVIAGAITAVFQKQGGRWVIVQEHLSDVPPAQTTTGNQPHDHD
jgi:hypothetical protein